MKKSILLSAILFSCIFLFSFEVSDDTESAGTRFCTKGNTGYCAKRAEQDGFDCVVADETKDCGGTWVLE